MHMNCSSICKDIKVSRKDAAKIRLHGFITRDMIAQEGDPILKDISYAKAKRICMFAKLSINIYNDEWVSLDYGDLDGLYLAYIATAPVENTTPAIEDVEEDTDVVIEASSDDEEPVEGEETVEEEQKEEENTVRLVLSDEIATEDTLDTTVTESGETEKISEMMNEESVVVRSEESNDEEEEVAEAADHATRYPDYNNYNKHYQKKKKK